MPTERATTFIDGYNLYFGFRTSGMATSRWLDLVALSRALKKQGRRLETARYFTTRVRNDQAAAARRGHRVTVHGSVVVPKPCTRGTTPIWSRWALSRSTSERTIIEVARKRVAPSTGVVAAD